MSDRALTPSPPPPPIRRSKFKSGADFLPPNVLAMIKPSKPAGPQAAAAAKKEREEKEEKKEQETEGDRLDAALLAELFGEPQPKAPVAPAPAPVPSAPRKSEATYAQLQASVDDYYTKLTERDTKIDKLEKDLKRNLAREDEVFRQNALLTFEIESCEKQLKEKSEGLAKAEKSITSLSTGHAEKVKELEKTYKDTKACFVDAQKSSDNFKAELDKEVAKTTSLQETITGAQGEYDGMVQQLQAWRQKENEYIEAKNFVNQISNVLSDVFGEMGADLNTENVLNHIHQLQQFASQQPRKNERKISIADELMGDGSDAGSEHGDNNADFTPPQPTENDYGDSDMPDFIPEEPVESDHADNNTDLTPPTPAVDTNTDSTPSVELQQALKEVAKLRERVKELENSTAAKPAADTNTDSTASVELQKALKLSSQLIARVKELENAATSSADELDDALDLNHELNKRVAELDGTALPKSVVDSSTNTDSLPSVELDQALKEVAKLRERVKELEDAAPSKPIVIDTDDEDGLNDPPMEFTEDEIATAQESSKAAAAATAAKRAKDDQKLAEMLASNDHKRPPRSPERPPFNWEGEIIASHKCTKEAEAELAKARKEIEQLAARIKELEKHPDRSAQLAEALKELAKETKRANIAEASLLRQPFLVDEAVKHAISTQAGRIKTLESTATVFVDVVREKTTFEWLRDSPFWWQLFLVLMVWSLCMGNFAVWFERFALTSVNEYAMDYVRAVNSPRTIVGGSFRVWFEDYIGFDRRLLG